MFRNKNSKLIIKQVILILIINRKNKILIKIFKKTFKRKIRKRKLEIKLV